MGFDAKLKMARILRIITKSQHRRLDTLRALRNKCAHFLDVGCYSQEKEIESTGETPPRIRWQKFSRLEGGARFYARLFDNLPETVRKVFVPSGHASMMVGTEPRGATIRDTWGTFMDAPYHRCTIRIDSGCQWEDYQVGSRSRLLSAVRNIHAGILLYSTRKRSDANRQRAAMMC